MSRSGIKYLTNCKRSETFALFLLQQLACSKQKAFHLFMITLFLNITAINLQAQKEDYQWIFNWSRIDSCDQFSVLGENCGATLLDFNYDPPQVYREEKITLDFSESNAVICDDEGQLLLYSNQQALYDFNHIPAINGDTINFGNGSDWSRFVWENENGEPRPNGYQLSQAIGIIPFPTKRDSFIVLYNNLDNNDFFSTKILYSIAAIDDIRDRFVIIEKDIELIDTLNNAGFLTACKHANGRDWWMLVFSENTAYSYLIDKDGIQFSHINQFPFILRKGLGQIKYNDNGSRLGYHYGVDFSETGTDLALFDFDRCSGVLSNGIYQIKDGTDNAITNGMAFSPSGRFMYRTTLPYVYQYDLEATDIFGSEIVVAEFDGYESPQTGFESYFGLMRRGPDNKIYISLVGQDSFLHVIHKPDSLGLACHVEQRAITLATYVDATVPNFNTYRLGPLDGSGCDTLGLDNHPQSRFRYEQDTLDYLDIQFVDLSFYRPESWEWDFGDGMSSTSISPRHVYNEKGVYEVCLTVSNENSSHQSCQTLNIGTTSTSEIEKVKILTAVYPNPTYGMFDLRMYNYLPEKAVMYLYDSSGKLMTSRRVFQGINSFNISDFSIGTYIYKIVDGNEIIDVGKIVKI